MISLNPGRSPGFCLDNIYPLPVPIEMAFDFMLCRKHITYEDFVCNEPNLRKSPG
jgi:hypothetical protein